MSKLPRFTVPLLGAISIAMVVYLVRPSDAREVRKAFRDWGAGKSSLFDLMTDDASIVIPGISRHCGTFSRSEFVRDVATPFMARFNEPPAPRAIKIWSDGDDVAVLADARGTRRDGMPYANNYVFVLKMRRGRIARATEFLDMAAFNDVWDHVEPASVIAAEAR